MISNSKIVIIFTAIILLILNICGCVEDQQQGENILKLSSPAFVNQGNIPSEYTCDGDDISPELNFVNIPKNTVSLALIMDDPDAPMGTWTHWLLWNIPPNVQGLSKGENISYKKGTNDFGNLDYGGPCPPSGTHRYFFKLYALDSMLDLIEGSNKNDLEAAMSGHIIEEAQLIGLYSR